MYRDKKILAIIPARAGSKRVPQKNIRNFCGKPLIAWTIEAALNSKIFDEIIVNSDSEEILSIGKEYGASTPFRRPASLATDNATSTDVILHTIQYYEENNKAFDIIVLLQPTSPLKTSDHIQEAIDLYIDKKASSVISVCELEHPIQWCNTLDKSLDMNNFLSKNVNNKRSQDLDQHYRLNGAIYILDTEKFKKHKTSIIPNSFAYIMEQYASIDIDTELDFTIAEAINLNKSNKHNKL